jgi:hypothetical protein
MGKHSAPIPGHPEGLPPESHNRDHDPVGEQAQDIGDDARRKDSRTTSPLERTWRQASNDHDPAPGSTGALIAELRRMDGEGRFDMPAFAGEPNHGDEPETCGGETTADDGVDAEAESLGADGEEDWRSASGPPARAIITCRAQPRSSVRDRIRSGQPGSGLSRPARSARR